jgi:hypothetical protein
LENRTGGQTGEAVRAGGIAHTGLNYDWHQFADAPGGRIGEVVSLPREQHRDVYQEVSK